MKKLLLLLLCASVLLGAPQVYFSPQDNLADRLIELIQKEEKSIRIAIYAMTNRKIAKELLAAKQRGVKVEMVCDPFAFNNKSPARYLQENGIKVFLFDPDKVQVHKSNKPIMHNKFAIFEKNRNNKRILWTGSFNFTYKATSKNKENALIIDDLDIIRAYEKEFYQIKKSYCEVAK